MESVDPKIPDASRRQIWLSDPRVLLSYSLRANPSLSIAARSSAASLGTNLA
jgi:hypothetical protein